MSGGISATTVMAGVSAAAAVGSTALTIIGASQQSDAQRQAGQIAYQNALMRNQMAQVQATQMEQAAGQTVAVGQRQTIEAQRKGQVLAGRARAVMAASGAGVDEGLIASLEGEGNYAGDVAAFDAGEKARGLRNQAAVTRWSGDAGIWSGENERGADFRAADATLVGGIGKGVLSFASKYGGGSAPGGDTSTGVGDSLTQAGSERIAQNSINAFGGPVPYLS